MEKELLIFIADFATWFRKWSDESDDCGFMNGDSDKYKGEDGQDQMATLGERAIKLLQQAGHNELARNETAPCAESESCSPPSAS